MTDDQLLAAIDRAIVTRRQEPAHAEGEQVITGAYGTADYSKVVSCYRRHQKIDIHGTLYRVRWVRVADGRFRAGVIACPST